MMMVLLLLAVPAAAAMTVVDWLMAVPSTADQEMLLLPRSHCQTDAHIWPSASGNRHDCWRGSSLYSSSSSSSSRMIERLMSTLDEDAHNLRQVPYCMS